MSKLEGEKNSEKAVYFTIDSELYAKMKVISAQQGISVKEFMTNAVIGSISYNESMRDFK